MDEIVVLFPRFFRLATPECTHRDYMNVPGPFFDEYGAEIPKHVKFQLPNGQEWNAIFEKEERKIYSVQNFFCSPPFTLTCCCVFNYLGSGVFIVYVFTDTWTEVKYASMGLNSFKQDEINGIGWKFLYVCYSMLASDQGSIKIPTEFKTRFGHLLPPELSLTLPNGRLFRASYSNEDGRIIGFRTFLFSDVLMFTYRGDGAFDVVLFSSTATEKSFSRNLTRNGAMIGIVSSQFKIQIHPYHLNYKYCHGIEILAEFKGCTNLWSSGTFINISYEDDVFKLQTVKNGDRWRIKKGWIPFLQKMRLAVGDVLVFNRSSSSPVDYYLFIYRYANRH